MYVYIHNYNRPSAKIQWILVIILSNISKGKSRMDNAETQAKWVTRYRQIRNNVTQKTMRKWADDGLTNQD